MPSSSIEDEGWLRFVPTLLGWQEEDLGAWLGAGGGFLQVGATLVISDGFMQLEECKAADGENELHHCVSQTSAGTRGIGKEGASPWCWEGNWDLLGRSQGTGRPR